MIVGHGVWFRGLWDWGERNGLKKTDKRGALRETCKGRGSRGHRFPGCGRCENSWCRSRRSSLASRVSPAELLALRAGLGGKEERLARSETGKVAGGRLIEVDTGGPELAGTVGCNGGRDVEGAGDGFHWWFSSGAGRGGVWGDHNRPAPPGARLARRASEV